MYYKNETNNERCAIEDFVKTMFFKRCMIHVLTTRERAADGARNPVAVDIDVLAVYLSPILQTLKVANGLSSTELNA